MRRLSYVPGMFSLGLLLPLCMAHVISSKAFLPQRSIKMTFPMPGMDDSYIGGPLTPQRLPDLYCNGPLDRALPVLRTFRYRMEALARGDDRRTLVHLRFGPDATYGTVMHAVETCRLSTGTWWLQGHDLVTWYHPPKRPG